MKTPPVLLIFFRRPEQTARVFEAIREARPERLFLAADGPRAHRPEEPAQCAATRAAVGAVDWPCEVKTWYREANAGIRTNVAEAITWFLDQVGEGIILEDDCLPSPDFFRFAGENLERYRTDERVMQICGSSFVSRPGTEGASYYFSRYGHNWGWATWKRAWDHLDLALDTLEDFLREARQAGFWDSAKEELYWTKMFRKTRDLPIDTWDYQWTMSLWRTGGLSIYPHQNLVTNLGFGDLASNTTEAGSTKGGRRPEALGPVVHPVAGFRDRVLDRRSFRVMYWGTPWERLVGKVQALRRRWTARG